MTYTPGPWEATTEDGQVDVSVPLPVGRRLVAICHRPAWVFPRDEGEANARLIAAAPKLLESCQSLLSFVRDLLERDVGMSKTHVEDHAKIITASDVITEAKAE